SREDHEGVESRSLSKCSNLKEGKLTFSISRLKSSRKSSADFGPGICFRNKERIGFKAFSTSLAVGSGSCCRRTDFMCLSFDTTEAEKEQSGISIETSDSKIPSYSGIRHLAIRPFPWDMRIRG